jgi:hypothetical protein
MVRRDEPAISRSADSCCIDLAGESPVRVSTSAPGSRPQHAIERSRAERGVESLNAWRKRSCGPQHEVNPAASSDYQPKGVWSGRAAHATAKATDSGRELEQPLDRSGVEGAGRSERAMRNTGGPRRQPSQAKTARISSQGESGRSRKGVRGAHSSDEGSDKLPERESPAVVVRASRVSARAWA